MISLPNNCNCSELTVNPKNWKTCKVSAMARNWLIQYYFYDHALERRKFVRVKNMNRFKTLSERREATAQLIENELYQLKEKGFNPILRSFMIEKCTGIDPRTSFIDALWQAFDFIKVESTTRLDIKSSINFFAIAAKKMGIDKMEIQSVKRRHLHQMIGMCAELKKRAIRWRSTASATVRRRCSRRRTNSGASTASDG